MGRWVVGQDGEGEPLFVAESHTDGTVSFHIPSLDPVVMTVERGEDVRAAVGAALGDAGSKRPT